MLRGAYLGCGEGLTLGVGRGLLGVWGGAYLGCGEGGLHGVLGGAYLGWSWARTKVETAEARKQRQATLRDQWVHASSIENSTPPTGAPKAACATTPTHIVMTQHTTTAALEVGLDNMCLPHGVEQQQGM